MVQPMGPKQSSANAPTAHEVGQALVVASRALVGIAARSLAAIEGELTLVQYRALVWLAERGPSNVGALAEAVGIHPSTATRLCDRLADKHLIQRANPPGDRREVVLTLAPAGRAIIDSVTRMRHAEIDRLVAGLDATARADIINALQHFAAVAGELPDDAWQLGWS